MSSDSIKKQVQQQFGKNAEKYITSPLHAKGEDLAQLVAASNANKQMNVLDIATGGGHVAKALAPLVHHVIAYDLTEDMLNTAAAFIRSDGHANVDFVAGDAEALPFDEHSFDLVTCRIAAHHFADVGAFLAEALRVVRPGGRLLLIDNITPENDAFDQFYNRIEKHRDASHVRAYKKSEWIRMIETTGFRIEGLTCFPKTFDYRSWCERSGLPEDERAALAASMLQAEPQVIDYFSITRDEAGELVSFTGESALFQAVKGK
ncbi:class I SAM-dependent methyltransferase [Paenibacillus sepulcri]|uniref:Methyltransferase domain-containing protein n=1 Tax=Paenibacillus sepulcri TaxID=359917 RepID=A0ABS7C3U8_9BACL|nr:methyltransferase domain-containing protein [Paenibacillus sepulcri]